MTNMINCYVGYKEDVVTRFWPRHGEREQAGRNPFNLAMEYLGKKINRQEDAKTCLSQVMEINAHLKDAQLTNALMNLLPEK
jgi:hypothetical protein